MYRALESLFLMYRALESLFFFFFTVPSSRKSFFNVRSPRKSFFNVLTPRKPLKKKCLNIYFNLFCIIYRARESQIMQDWFLCTRTKVRYAGKSYPLPGLWSGWEQWTIHASARTQPWSQDQREAGEQKDLVRNNNWNAFSVNLFKS